MWLEAMDCVAVGQLVTKRIRVVQSLLFPRRALVGNITDGSVFGMLVDVSESSTPFFLGGEERASKCTKENQK